MINEEISKEAGQAAQTIISYTIKAAKATFSALNTKKLPTIKELSKEYEKLLTEKKNLYSDSRKKKKIQEILTLKSNVDRLLYPP